MLNEGLDLCFEVTGKIVVLEQDAVLQRLMPALDLALGLRMTWRAAKMLDLPLVEPLGETCCDIAGTIIRQQTGFVSDVHLAAACSDECLLQRAGDVTGGHRGAELPGDDVAREVVEDAREVEPSPTDDLQVGEVGLPKLIGCRGFGVELIGGLDDDERRAGDQVMRLEQAIL